MAMELVAVTKDAVQILEFQAGAEMPAEPTHTFPPVPTAEGYGWSADGKLLGLADAASGGVTVYDASEKYAVVCKVLPLIGGPVRGFYFSPLGTFLVTYERHIKEKGDNIGVWDIASGELQRSFVLKNYTEMTWPPMKWTSTETHCCRMVQDGVVVMAGKLQKDDETTARITAPGIMAFEVAPKGFAGSEGHVAIVIGESKGQPARCQIFRLDALTAPTAAKSFYKVQRVTMRWNNVGSALLVLTAMDVDDTGKNYYGNTNLYFMRPDGQQDSIVASASDGPVHDVQWNPTQDEFFLLHGDLPCQMMLFDGKKGTKKMEFGKAHRNTIRWNNFGRFLFLGGFGQLAGDTDFWDKPGKNNLGSVRMECCVVSSWAPDGRHFLGATTSPRMRVDNKIQIYDYCGSLLGQLDYEELLWASWRPRPRGAFQDRPPSPDRKQRPSEAKASGPAPKKQAYRPPGARGGGGLAALLRQELGSTAGESHTTAVKVGTAAASAQHPLPPGATFVDESKAASSSSSAARNARKKKAKEAAKAVDEASQQEQLAPALQPVEPSAPSTSSPNGGAAAESKPDDEGADAEKKARALRKKLREIEKLKEKHEKDLEPNQRQKMAQEADLLRQLADLGAEA
mmetsp:Transcript_19504/g.45344  ORF Transcript_19504/g.45344 Transcript_19504/m.45344 type:complete len:626 (-) Transcript_19504:413-2290(-)